MTASEYNQQGGLDQTMVLPTTPLAVRRGRKMKLSNLSFKATRSATPSAVPKPTPARCKTDSILQAATPPPATPLPATPLQARTPFPSTPPNPRRDRNPRLSKLNLDYYSPTPTNTNNLNTPPSSHLSQRSRLLTHGKSSQVSPCSNSSGSNILTPRSSEFSPAQYPDYRPTSPDLSNFDFSIQTPTKIGKNGTCFTLDKFNEESLGSSKWSPIQNGNREYSPDLSNFDFSVPIYPAQSTNGDNSPGLSQFTLPTQTFAKGSVSDYSYRVFASPDTKPFPLPNQQPVPSPGKFRSRVQTSITRHNERVSISPTDVTSLEAHDLSIFTSNFTPPPNHPIEASPSLRKFRLEHMVWMDAMMIRRQAEGRYGELFVTDQQDFEKRFGWMPSFGEFLLFALEYARDPMFYCNWFPEERLYDLPC